MLLTALALSASLQFDCPQSIDTRQQLLSQPRGWQAVALFDGDPGELAQLKPDNGDNAETHYWSLDSRNPRPFYLVCHYRGTAITLQQALPPGINYCRVNQTDSDQLHGLICRQ
ncbi:STY0301 family protein [Aeromonas salmonicida]|uniref:STY0301 family protein n=1 Tax=Aeromonas salmonicida TaxID=645 RepID=UPI003D088E12